MRWFSPKSRAFRGETRQRHDPAVHPLPIDSVKVTHELDDASYSVTVFCLVATHAKTGVEMEALAGVSSALLTIYDLTKMVEPALTISDTKLLAKTGGKQGVWVCPQGIPDWVRQELGLDTKPVLSGFSAAVVTLSDRASSGIYEDKSGALLQHELRQAGADIVAATIIPDDKEMIMKCLSDLAASSQTKSDYHHGRHRYRASRCNAGSPETIDSTRDQGLANCCVPAARSSRRTRTAAVPSPPFWTKR